MFNYIWMFVAVALALGLVAILVSAFFWVEQRTLALVQRLGSVVREVGPGLHLKVPFIDRVIGRIDLAARKPAKRWMPVEATGHRGLPPEATGEPEPASDLVGPALAGAAYLSALVALVDKLTERVIFAERELALVTRERDYALTLAGGRSFAEWRTESDLGLPGGHTQAPDPPGNGGDARASKGNGDSR